MPDESFSSGARRQQSVCTSWQEFIPVAFNLLVERLANTFLAASPTAASEAP